MSAINTQYSDGNPVRRAALWLLLKLAIAASLSVAFGTLFGWSVGETIGFGLGVSLVIDLAMTWQEERRTERGEFELLNDMVGDTGVVTTLFVREDNGFPFHGRVRVRGENWAAVFPGQRALEPGERIRVRGRKGLTLVVHRHAEARTNNEQPLP